MSAKDAFNAADKLNTSGNHHIQTKRHGLHQ